LRAAWVDEAGDWDERGSVWALAVLDLFRRGYLQLIYLMLASLKHVSALARKKNLSFLPGGASRGSGTA